MIFPKITASMMPIFPFIHLWFRKYDLMMITYMVCITSNLYWSGVAACAERKYEYALYVDYSVVTISLLYLFFKAYKMHKLGLYSILVLPGLLGYAYAQTIPCDGSFRWHCLNHIFGHISNFVFY